MLTIQNLQLQNATVFIRCDYNVPLDDFGNIRDDRRIRESLATIHYALDHNCKIILASHLGRPKGTVNKKFSLAPVAKRLNRLLDLEIHFASDVIGEDAHQKIDSLKNGEILLLENLRFEPGETKNDPAFAQKLANLADFYVNDAFGVCHRAHASVEAITHYFDSQHKGAGFLLQKEINFFHDALQKPPHPFTLIVGGSKVSTKLEALQHLLPEVDKMLIGGGMAFTFLKALGYETGDSIVEEDLIPAAKEIVETAKRQNVKLFLPVDFIVAKEIEQETKSKIVTFQDIPDGYMGLDIGPATRQLFEEATEKAKIILWNGPMGVFEIEKFSHGSLNLARFIATLHATKIIGGGDTAEMIHKARVTEKMTFVSTGGGASLELLAGKELPGIKALEQ
jgi:phosphoglycerate kinase